MPRKPQPQSHGRADFLLRWTLIVLLVLFHIAAVVALAWLFSLWLPSSGGKSVG